DQIHVIPLGADHERFQFDPTARHEVRTKLSIHENDIVFIYTGKIVPKKKLSVLIQALGRLASANNDVKLILVGSGPQDYVSRLKDEANSLKLGDKLVWHDTVPNEELPRYYSAADVAVWPAWASISMLEAMSCGLPIIVSDSRNINEMTFVTSALTYSGYDPSNLAEQMQRLLDPIFRQRLGQEGRRIIDEKLNWKVIAKQFVDIAEGGML
ncbi:MAG: glycosyltransferase family 4 protein, partial [Dehalococcoidia bacterium]